MMKSPRDKWTLLLACLTFLAMLSPGCRGEGWSHWSSFSRCSRTCGGGIKIRDRSCTLSRSGGCIGKTKIYKSCNLKECPPGSRDFRTVQCEEFNSLPYNGKYFNWVPYYNATDECSLICKAEGQGFHEKLKNQVVDGTPCGKDGQGRCADGHCKQTGCDGKLGSRLRFDACGVCGGDNSSCSRVPPGRGSLPTTASRTRGTLPGSSNTITGFFNKDPLDEGYNRVVDIPAGATDIILQEEGGNLNTVAMRTDTDTLMYERGQKYNGELAGTTFMTDTHPQSTHNGRGFIATGPTNQDISVFMLNKGHRNPGIQYRYTLNGDGTGRSNIPNIERQPNMPKENNDIVPNSAGGDDIWFPHPTDTHLEGSVDTTITGSRYWENSQRYMWSYGDWAACSESCGEGLQFRAVSCIDRKLRKATDAKYCEENSRPEGSQRCKVKDCGESSPIGTLEKYVWSDGVWSECSETCGQGVQYLVAKCIERETKGTVDSGLCEIDRQPVTSRMCNIRDCGVPLTNYERYEWSYGVWSACSQTCGEGLQYRDVVCIDRVLRNSVDSVLCGKIGQAVTSQTCNIRDCELPVREENFGRYSWSYGSWSSCSQTCGNGVQYRDVSCIDRETRRPLDYRLCEVSRRPVTSQSCNIRDCLVGSYEQYTWISGSWSSCSQTCGNGVQYRDVSCIERGSRRTVDYKLCEVNRRPVASQPCKIRDCVVPILVDRYTWSYGDWSECSQTCGNGIQVRDISCIQRDTRRAVDPELCEAIGRPFASQPCNIRDCAVPVLVDLYTWSYGDWSECSRTCGNGIQVRDISCIRRDTRRAVDYKRCEAIRQPLASQPCKIRDCAIPILVDLYTWSYGDWSECSQTCGNGIQVRDISCIQRDTRRAVDYERCEAIRRPLASQPCKIRDCAIPILVDRYTWSYGAWSSCSQTCGNGVQVRDVSCIGRDSRRTVDYKLCETVRRPVASQSCKLKDCGAIRIRVNKKQYLWSYGVWSSCSQTCGYGVQYRDVSCMERETRKPVDQAICKASSSPVTSQSCYVRDCREPVRVEQYTWSYGDWSTCSQTCGNGVQYRDVSCIERNSRRTVDNIRCETNRRPVASQSCYIRDCREPVRVEQYTWSYGDWSTCSQTCGNGVQYRDVSCIERNSRRTVDNIRCETNRRPVASQSCYIRDCREPVRVEQYTWSYGDWSTCSQTCGNGVQYRDVSCIERNSRRTVDNIRCETNRRPVASQSCYIRDCREPVRVEQYTWSYGDWSTCSQMCGNGVQYRNVSCIERNYRRTVDNIRCETNRRPVASQSCYIRDCREPVRVEQYTWSYGDWSTCSQTCGNGVQYRDVSCTERNSRRTVDDVRCETNRRPVASQTCYVRDCRERIGGDNFQRYVWSYRDWSACSATCGDGVQYRDASCRDRVFRKIVESAFCDMDQQRDTSRVCKERDCAIVDYFERYAWSYRDWSTCSKTCGDGVQYRDAYCADRESRRAVRSSLCDRVEQQITSRVCKVRDCVDNLERYMWSYRDWGACSKTCGDGVQYRESYCVERESRRAVTSSLCEVNRQQITSRVCRIRDCVPDFDRYTWSYRGWGACSKTCGDGVQYRESYCVERESRTVSSSFCEASRRLATSQVCKVRDCAIVDSFDQYTWSYRDWGACSKTCGDGIQYRDVYCVDRASRTVRSSLCEASRLPITSQRCSVRDCVSAIRGDNFFDRYLWTFTDWGSCSRTCGDGVQYREASCIDTETRRTVDTARCEVNCEAVVSRACNVKDCEEMIPISKYERYKLSYGDWSACSETCGDGFQYRDVSCIDRDLRKSVDSKLCEENQRYKYRGTSCRDRVLRKNVDSAFCDANKQVVSSRVCKVRDCDRRAPIAFYQRYMWSYRDWGACSTTCGQGVQYRDVVCVDRQSGRTIESSICAADCTPVTSRNCNVRDCVSDVSISERYMWSYGEWSTCSVTCGDGFQNRDVSCIGRESRRPVDSALCRANRAPVVERKCNMRDCEIHDRYMWSRGEWTSCSVECGIGYQRRSVSCVDRLQREVADSLMCNQREKPVSSRSCDAGPCGSNGRNASFFRWGTGPWSVCSTTCDDGEQTKDVYCEGVYADGTVFRARDRDCLNTYNRNKPEYRRSCPGNRPCFRDGGRPRWTYSDWSQCSATCGRGQQSRRVLCSWDGSVSSRRNILSDDACDSALKPTAVRSCSERACRTQPCMQTYYGCCPDGVTPARGFLGEGCRDNIVITDDDSRVDSCRQSRWGCCPDAVTRATGPNYQGCRIRGSQAHCTLESHAGGCVNTEVKYTVKWYYNAAERRCERFWYKGCGGNENRFDNENECRYSCHSVISDDVCRQPKVVGRCRAAHPRWYYNFNRRTCEQFTYGGCDGNGNRFRTRQACEQRCLSGTEALGDNGRDTLLCQRSRYGCCSDGVTPAQGVNGAGCPNACESTRYGCCDDRISAAQGPNQEGCEIIGSGDVDADCDESQWGCCPDGVTAARGPNEEGCEFLVVTRKPSTDTDIVVDVAAQCRLPQDMGPCRTNMTVMWFYNTTAQMCQRFWFGCRGNANRFKSEKECLTTCRNVVIRPDPLPQCQQPKDPGSCNTLVRSYSTRWWHNPYTRQCEEFLYEGCQGNRNNFETRDNCERSCGVNRVVTVRPDGRVSPCSYSPDVGPCRRSETKWYYDMRTLNCKTFTYGGCLGNHNNFQTQEKCEDYCGPRRGGLAQEICLAAQDAGPCRTSIGRWHYDASTGRCHEFTYGGCQGNANNFADETSCMDVCRGVRRDYRTPAPRPLPGPTRTRSDCTLDKDTGPCRANIQRWYYDQIRGQCFQFTYGGCNGNQNNFEDERTCEEFCRGIILVIEPEPPISPPPPVRNTTDICALGLQSPCLNVHGGDYWYYDHNLGYCREVPNDECNANENNFESRERCEMYCSRERVCRPFRMGAISCAAAIPRWRYSYESGFCEEFIYGGCGGTSNNFQSLEYCERKCEARLQTQPPVRNGTVLDVCALPLQTPCRNARGVQYWYYDMTSGYCREVPSGDCNNNQNNFESRERCESYCSRERVCRTFRMESAISCTAAIPRWRYNMDTAQCEEFIYGGCGGTSNNFGSAELCERKCEPRAVVPVTDLPPVTVTRRTKSPEEVCALPDEKGNCEAYMPRWHYDSLTGKCEEFIYGGCGGNENNFLTKEACEQYCSREVVCRPFIEPNPTCLAYFPRFRYVASSGDCESFIYGGCGGNANNFETIEACRDKCRGWRQTQPGPVRSTWRDICLLKPDVGPCRMLMRKWHYDEETGDCKEFTYGGCLGNHNNFDDREQCLRYCDRRWLDRGYTYPTRAPVVVTTDDEVEGSGDEHMPSRLGVVLEPAYLRWVTESTAVCALANDTGSCTDYAPAWYYDHLQGSCRQFTYGGCGGNENRFSTLEECESRCHPREVCILPQKSGQCLAYFPRYYYDYTDGQCKDFIYGGCEGNANNFETRETCQRRCSSLNRGRPAVIKKPGKCPGLRDYFRGTCADQCRTDGDCPGEYKCCTNGCGLVCVPPAGTVKPGFCPVVPSNQVGVCVEDCRSDGDCESNKKCCSNGCGHVCLTPVAAKAGYCPAVDRNSVGTCVEECRSDVDCPDNRKCCSNGCGHTCQYPTEYRDREPSRPQLDERYAKCAVPHNQGNCNEEQIKWYYDPSIRDCRRFWYTGCGGNGNKFESREECVRTCYGYSTGDYTVRPVTEPVTQRPPTTPEVRTDFDLCDETAARGRCSNYTVKWFFNKTLGRCERFWYGGCDGNANRFDDERECLEFCYYRRRGPDVYDCRRSRYGCCPDGQTAARDPEFRSCPGYRSTVGPYDCRRSIYGCCPDGYTPARDPDYRSCPGYQTTPEPYDCRRSRYGCCPDGYTAASDPDLRSCPGAIRTTEQLVNTQPGGRVTLNCYYPSNSIADVTWYRNGRTIQSDSNFEVLANGTLLIRYTTTDNEGIYGCTVAIGNRAPITQRFRVRVLVPIGIFPTPSTIVIKPGQMAFLHCQAYGSPQPTVSWSKENVPIVSDSRHNVFPNGTLMINRAEESDAGYYVCKAQNQVSLSVRRTIRLSLKEMLVARIEKDAGRVTEGDRISLHCHGTGYPQPTVQWEKSGRTIVPSGRIRIRENGHLTIANATLGDTGLYTCIVSNSEEKMETTTTIQVIPRYLQEDDCKDMAGTMKCRLIITAKLCKHQPYASICCDSCRQHGGNQ